MQQRDFGVQANRDINLREWAIVDSCRLERNKRQRCLLRVNFIYNSCDNLDKRRGSWTPTGVAANSPMPLHA